jgi:lysophospholipase L1-like esterase
MKKSIAVLSLFLSIQLLFGQGIPFQQEVDNRAKEIDSTGWDKGSVVFTGSSSIRMWKNLQEQFPEVAIINTGFGGSQAIDLINHLDQTVLKYDPSKVFIYEGDNDINSGKEASEIMEDLDVIVTKIHIKYPFAIVNLIVAKPSPSRWQSKQSYIVLNDLIRQYATTHKDVNIVNVWDIMLDDSGKPRNDIFLGDDLHMNEKGYELWKEIFTPFLK